MTERDLDGRTALVTGGARDMGRGIALGLARHGADVVIGYGTSAGAADETLAALRAHGVRAHAVAADVREPGEVRRLAEAALEFGEGRVDILVNNAGGIIRRAYLAELTPELIDETMMLNFGSALLACQALIPGMAERGHGRVVNVGSVAAHAGGAATAHHYAASKAAITSLGRSLTKEFGARGVTINTVAPGMIDNAFHAVHTPREQFDATVKTFPLARAGSNDDVAGAVAFLASDAASYISGEVLHVNGGQYFS
jgi:3-oxoacyl-[acyl-carrier protein] reductase